MPITFACMLICTLAIAGVPYFAGFFSKDEIIKAGVLRILDARTFDGWSLYALIALSAAAALTAFYMFRLIFLTFYGEYRGNLKEHRFSAMLAAEGVEGPDPNEHAPEEHGHEAAHGHDDHGHEEHDHGGAHAHGHRAEHAPAPAHPAHHEEHGGHGAHAHEPHESPWVITVALMILAALGIFGGHFWLTDPLGVFHPHPWFEELVTPASLYGEEVARWCAPEPAGEAASHFAHLEHEASRSRSCSTSCAPASPDASSRGSARSTRPCAGSTTSTSSWTRPSSASRGGSRTPRSGSTRTSSTAACASSAP
jgi:NADH:ubiquinone oxidoreductase subunit 5 (subunit L)/multisubunit Na+/H+ antiporter MnhA subunit